MRRGRRRGLSALLAAAGLVCAVFIVARPVAVDAVGVVAEQTAVQAVADDIALVAAPPAHSAHLVAKPVKRLPWGAAEPVRWSAALLTVLTLLTFGVVASARRTLRWRAFVLRAPPISAVG